MLTRQREDYLTHIDWFNSVIDEDIILRGTSALECLQHFTGYRYETEIYAYALQIGKYDNINYSIVNNYDGIDYFVIGNIKCTTFQQTVNDMLADFENTDELALTEALSDYYFEHEKSFRDLLINPENKDVFEQISENAIHYYETND